MKEAFEPKSYRIAGEGEPSEAASCIPHDETDLSKIQRGSKSDGLAKLEREAFERGQSFFRIPAEHTSCPRLKGVCMLS